MAFRSYQLPKGKQFITCGAPKQLNVDQLIGRTETSSNHAAISFPQMNLKDQSF